MALSKRSSINQSFCLYKFARPTGLDQSVRVQSRAIISRDGHIPAAAASGFGLWAKVLIAMSGLSTMGNAAEVASDSNDSTSPAGCS
jgi:large subunit ribosomal protein L19